MDLNDRQFNRLDCVVHRVRVVREGAGIEGDPVCVLASLVQPIDQSTLMVRLKRLDLETVSSTPLCAQPIELAERGGSVRFGFPRAQKTQVGTVEDEDATHDENRLPAVAGEGRRAEMCAPALCENKLHVTNGTPAPNRGSRCPER
jgi:hypothetical protein